MAGLKSLRPKVAAMALLAIKLLLYWRDPQRNEAESYELLTKFT